MPAKLMRLVGICEERGSSVDKIVSQTELYHLPPLIFETDNFPLELSYLHKNS